MSTAVLSRPRATALPRLAGYGALAGLVAGIAMALWQMIDSAATSNGFWTPLNLCMAAGMILHLAFSVLVGIVFITILFGLRRAGLGLLRTAPGYIGAAIAGAALLYVVMIYLVLPWANPLMCHMTPRGPFFIGHLIYGLIFGLVSYPLARRAAESST